MPEISPADWEAVETAFQQNSTLPKLKRFLALSGEDKPYSFFKAHDTAWALTHYLPPVIIDSDDKEKIKDKQKHSARRLKYVQNSAGEEKVVKIYKHPTSGECIPIAARVEKLYPGNGQFLERQTPTGWKSYILMPHLGKDLVETINEEILNDPKRNAILLDIAIGMALEVRRIHLAGIIHRDIKPDNFTIDEASNVHIIDVDTSHSFSEKPCGKRGSREYIPLLRPKNLSFLAIKERAQLENECIQYLFNAMEPLLFDYCALRLSLFKDTTNRGVLSMFSENALSPIIRDWLRIPLTYDLRQHSIKDIKDIYDPLFRDGYNITPIHIAAVLIEYQHNPQITQERIHEIQANGELQAALINHYLEENQIDEYGFQRKQPLPCNSYTM